MKIRGEALIKELICWFLASVKCLKGWRPLTEPVEEYVEIALSTLTMAPDLELGRERLSRGPTFLTRRSDL